MKPIAVKPISPSHCCICRVGTRLRLVMRHERHGQVYGLFECADCDLQFWYPNQAADEQVYDKARGSGLILRLPPHKAHRPPQLDFIRKHPELIAGARLLDIGCADGGFMYEAQERGALVWGVDYDAAAVERAGRCFGLSTALHMTLEAFIAAPPVTRLDIVTAFEVVEHVPDPIALIRGVAKLLEPGGHFVLSIPSRNRLFVNLSSFDYPPHHLTRWDEKAIRQALEKNGFAVREVLFQGRFMSMLMEITRVMRLDRLWGVVKLRYRDFKTDSPRARAVFIAVQACSWSAEAFLIAIGGIPASILTVISMMLGKTSASMLVVARRR